MAAAAATTHTFALLKPVCLPCMQLVAALNQSPLSSALTPEPLFSLARLLLLASPDDARSAALASRLGRRVPAHERASPDALLCSGLPRCIDYVNIPLLLLLPELPLALAPPAGDTPPSRSPPPPPDRVAEACLRAITALVIAAGPDVFCAAATDATAPASRVADVLCRCIAILAPLGRSGESGAIGGSSVFAEETLAAACDLMALLCAFAGGGGDAAAASVEGASTTELWGGGGRAWAVAADVCLGTCEATAVTTGVDHGRAAAPPPPGRRADVFRAVVPQPLHTPAVVSALVSALLEIAEGPDMSGSVEPRRTTPHYGRRTQLAALRALESVIVALCRTEGNTPPALHLLAPGPHRLAPFLPGIVTALLRIAVPPPAAGSVEHPLPSRWVRVTAAALSTLATLLRMCLSDSVRAAALGSVAPSSAPAPSNQHPIAAQLHALQQEHDSRSCPPTEPAHASWREVLPPRGTGGKLRSWWGLTASRVETVIVIIARYASSQWSQGGAPSVLRAAIELFSAVTQCCRSSLVAAVPAASDVLMLLCDDGSSAAGNGLEGDRALRLSRLPALLARLPLVLLSCNSAAPFPLLQVAAAAGAHLSDLSWLARATSIGRVRKPSTLSFTQSGGAPPLSESSLEAATRLSSSLPSIAFLRLLVAETQALSTPCLDAHAVAAAFLQASCVWQLAVSDDEPSGEEAPLLMCFLCVGLTLNAHVRMLETWEEDSSGFPEPPFLSSVSTTTANEPHVLSMGESPILHVSASVQSVVSNKDSAQYLTLLSRLISALGACLTQEEEGSQFIAFLSTALERSSLNEAAARFWTASQLLSGASAAHASNVALVLPRLVSGSKEASLLDAARASGRVLSSAARVVVPACCRVFAQALCSVNTDDDTPALQLLACEACRLLCHLADALGRAMSAFVSSVISPLLQIVGGVSEGGAFAVSARLHASAAISLKLIALSIMSSSSPLVEARVRLIPLPGPLRVVQSFPVQSIDSISPLTLSVGSPTLHQLIRVNAPLSRLLCENAAALAEGPLAALRPFMRGHREISLAPVSLTHSDWARALAAPAVIDASLMQLLFTQRQSLGTHPGASGEPMPLLEDFAASVTAALRGLSAASVRVSRGVGIQTKDARFSLQAELLRVAGNVAVALGPAVGDTSVPLTVSEEELARGEASAFAPMGALRSLVARARYSRQQMAPVGDVPTLIPQRLSILAAHLQRSLPWLPDGARAVALSVATAAAQHIGAAAAAVVPTRSGVPAIALPLHALRLTALSIRVLIEASCALARHPDTLFPLLADTWPHLVALLPPVDVAQALLGAFTSGAGIDAISVCDSRLHALLLPPCARCTPAALPSPPPRSTALRPPPTLSDITLAFMTRRASLLNAAAEKGSGAPRRQPAPRVHRVSLLSGEAQDAATDAAALVDAARLVREVSVPLTAQRIRSSAEHDRSPSSGTSHALLVQVAALELISALAGAPRVSADERAACASSPHSRVGACAGSFLSSRFHSDVWPRVRAVLLAAALLSAVIEQRGSAPLPVLGEGHPALRLMLCAVRLCAHLAAPCVDFEREPLPGDKEGEEEGGGAAAEGEGTTRRTRVIFGSGRHRVVPFGSDAASADSLGASAAHSGPPPLSRISLSAPLLQKEAWDAACLLAQISRCGGVGSGGWAAALRAEALAALAAVERHCDTHAVALACGR